VTSQEVPDLAETALSASGRGQVLLPEATQTLIYIVEVCQGHYELHA
jgi:hypothetical protein